MIAVFFVLLASMTLLPAVLGKLGTKVNGGSLPYAKRQEHRSPKFAAWGGELLHKHPWPFAIGSVLVLIALSIPVLGLKVAMLPSKSSPPTPRSAKDTNSSRPDG